MPTIDMTEKFVIDDRFIRTKRANELMKAAWNMRQTVYVYGATGFGKTSFVKSFLNRKKHSYFSMDNCEVEDLEAWYQAFKEQESIIVIDDLHVIVAPEEREQYYDILQKIVTSRNIWVVFISRSTIPAWIMQLYIHNVFTVISEDDLKFTDQNLQEYLDQWDLILLPTTVDLLKKVAMGFPLFCRIAALRLQGIRHTITKTEERAQAEVKAIEDAKKDWWDYLDGFVFDQWDVTLQEFVMELSIVEQFDLQMAQIITKHSDAGSLLALAQEIGNYVIEHTTKDGIFYEFRVPVRLAMLRRLQRRCSENRINELYYNAGSCYEYQDKVVPALQMYEMAHNEDGITRLLIRNSRKHAGAGHYWELREYYKMLPKEVIRQNVELMTAVSLLHSILMDDETSDYWYHELENFAKTHSGSERRLAQAKLLTLDIALPQKGTVKMVDMIKNAGTLITNKGYILSEVSITNNQPSVMQGGKDFCEWSKKDRVLAQSIGKLLEFVLGKNSKGLVNIALAESQFEKGGDSYEISALAAKGRLQAESHSVYEEEFVAVAILAQLEAQNSRLEDAIESLQSFRMSIPSDKEQLCASVDTMKIRLLLYNGSSDEIFQWMENAPDEDKEFCTLERFHYITKVRVYLSLGKNLKASQLLAKLQYFADLRERVYLQIETGILLAIAQYRMDSPMWIETLQKAITHAEEYHFVRILIREGAALWELLKAHEFKWKDADFKEQVFEECEAIADLYPAYLRVKQSGNIALSEMEIKVLRMQAEGMSVEKIADALSLSKAGVKYYNQQTYKKLGVNSKAQAVNEAKNRKLI